MDSSEMENSEAGRAAEDADGFALRVTARGALVLQTENARRMMHRLGRFARETEEVAADAVDPTGTAPASP
jgi:hypothetical protein